LARRVRALIDARGDADLPPAAALYATHAVASRFDGPDVTFVKRVLQKGLPPRVRGDIIRQLFDEYVGIDPRVVARELYMDLDQPLTLPRLDTNDLPRRGDASPAALEAQRG